MFFNAVQLLDDSIWDIVW